MQVSLLWELNRIAIRVGNVSGVDKSKKKKNDSIHVQDFTKEKQLSVGDQL